MAKKKKGGKTISVDFSDTQSTAKLPEGDYPVKVKEITNETSQSGNPYLKWVFEVSEGTHKGRTLYHNTSLQPQALFNLRNTLEALQYPVSSEAMKINLDELTGLEAAVAVELETYQGKERPRIVDIFALDELVEDEEDEDDEDEEEDIDDEESEDESEDDDNEDDDEADEADDEDDDDEDDDEDDEDDDEDDEELEEYTQEDLEEMDDEDLLDAADEYEVDAVYKGKGKKKKLDREATIEAILEAQDEE
jgi:hypothetical protein